MLYKYEKDCIDDVGGHLMMLSQTCESFWGVLLKTFDKQRFQEFVKNANVPELEKPLNELSARVIECLEIMGNNAMIVSDRLSLFEDLIHYRLNDKELSNFDYRALDISILTIEEMVEYLDRVIDDIQYFFDFAGEFIDKDIIDFTLIFNKIMLENKIENSDKLIDQYKLVFNYVANAGIYIKRIRSLLKKVV